MDLPRSGSQESAFSAAVGSRRKELSTLGHGHGFVPASGRKVSVDSLPQDNPGLVQYEYHAARHLTPLFGVPCTLAYLVRYAIHRWTIGGGGESYQMIMVSAAGQSRYACNPASAGRSKRTLSSQSCVAHGRAWPPYPRGNRESLPCGTEPTSG